MFECLKKVLGVVLLSIACVSARPVYAQANQAAVIADVTGDAARDAQTQLAMKKWLAKYGYQAVPDALVQGAAQRSGALATGTISTDPAALEALRTEAGARVVVRAYSSGVDGQGRHVHLVLVDRDGFRRVERVLPEKELNVRMVGMIDAAWKVAATPITAAPPPPPPVPVVPPPGAAPPVTPAPAVATRAPLDRVFLLDGTVIEGRVTHHRPGAFVTITGPSGASETIAWSAVQRVVLAPRAGMQPGTGVQVPPAGPGVAPAGGPITTTRTGADASLGQGLTLSQESGCPPGAPPEQCQERSRLAANDQGVNFNREVNCAPGSTDTRCTEKMSAGIGKGGVGASYHTETVERVTTPKSGSANFDLGATLVTGFGTGDSDITMIGVGVTLGFTILAGSQFPGPSGGSFSGIFIEPTASIQLMNMSMGDMSFQTNGLNGQGAIGYQYIKFGALDPTTLTQSGFGFRIGGTVGYQMMRGTYEMTMPQPVYDEFGNIVGMQDVTTEQDFESDSESYGPTLGFSAVKYNPGTAKMTSFDVNLFVLPTGDFIMAMIGLQGKL